MALVINCLILMINFCDSTHYELWFMNEEVLKIKLCEKNEACLKKIETNMDWHRHNVKGDSPAQKAANFNIKPDVEEKVIADAIMQLRQHWLAFNNFQLIATAASFLQRFYVRESIFIWDPR